MAEEEKKPEGCTHTECAMNWLKGIDGWTIGGYTNRLPRLYFVVLGLVLLFILI